MTRGDRVVLLGALEAADRRGKRGGDRRVVIDSRILFVVLAVRTVRKTRTVVDLEAVIPPRELGDNPAFCVLNVPAEAVALAADVPDAPAPPRRRANATRQSPRAIRRGPASKVPRHIRRGGEGAAGHE